MHATMRMHTADATQRKRYLDALGALATAVLGELHGREPEPQGEELLEQALAEVHRFEREAGSEHAWIFRDPAVLLLSDNLFEALELRPDGRREYLQADLPSAVAAVARHDLMVEIVERVGEFAEEDDEVGEVAGVGEA